MKKIPLTRGLFALVDDEDFERLSRHKWRANSGGYAVRDSPSVNGKRHAIYMHREIMSPASGVVIDHINGDKRDNRRENLRVCSRSENLRNQRRRSDNTSGFKGVNRHTQKGLRHPWIARVKVNHRGIHLGCFATPEEAARAYDAAALKHHGEFAHLNFPTT